MRGMFVEGKLLKGDILVSKTNNTPALPTPFIKIRQEEGFFGGRGVLVLVLLKLGFEHETTQGREH